MPGCLYRVPSGADLKLGDALPRCGRRERVIVVFVQGREPVSPPVPKQVTGDHVREEAWMQAPENTCPQRTAVHVSLSSPG